MAAILGLTGDDVRRITDGVYVGRRDPARDLSAFWVLLVLSAVIASAGVVSDSTATVIGAMIVAPLMRPILGTACALVLSDRRELTRAVLYVCGGALSVVVVAFVMGLLMQTEVVAATNSQVAGRVSPRLIDLVAAIATGLVGAFAVIRSDVSDTLPGVAIAISLVPPLAVIGLTLESGEPGQALGALLLFGTNVAAIISTGVALLLAAGLRPVARAAGEPVGRLRGRTLGVVVGSLALVAVPLAIGSFQVARDQYVVATAQPATEAWAEEHGFTVAGLSMRGSTLQIDALGPSLDPRVEDLRAELADVGLGDTQVELTFGLGDTITVTTSP